MYDLEASTWFCAVGKRIGDESIVHVRSWGEALEACRSDEWDANRIEEANEIRLQLPREQMQRWNPTVVAVRPEVAELVEAKTAALKLATRDLSEVVDTARWDLLHACLEIEFADYLKTRFYRDVAAWYLQGHFPCGWAGDPERGRHMIY